MKAVRAYLYYCNEVCIIIKIMMVMSLPSLIILLSSPHQVVVLTGWKPGSGATNTMRIIAATNMADKAELPPIVGMKSVPSFNSLA